MYFRKTESLLKNKNEFESVKYVRLRNKLDKFQKLFSKRNENLK